MDVSCHNQIKTSMIVWLAGNYRVFGRGDNALLWLHLTAQDRYLPGPLM